MSFRWLSGPLGLEPAEKCPLLSSPNDDPRLRKAVQIKHRLYDPRLMGHLTAKGAYQNLVRRINKFPQGAPPSEALYRILELLFSEDQAALVARLPLRPFELPTAARIWKKTEAESHKILDELCDKGLMLDIDRHGRSQYVLPPPMAGFIEFSMMRVRTDLDQKLLSELLDQYLNVEGDFVRELFGKGDTQFGRVFVNEEALPAEPDLKILDFERATEVIKTARTMGVSLCYCRHKRQHLGATCSAPLDICMTFGTTARALIKHRLARPVDSHECLDLLSQAYEQNLVQFGENVREKVAFICNCCSCCCEAMLAAQELGFFKPVQTTCYIPKTRDETCSGCGRCVSVCPVNALCLVSAKDPANKKRKKAFLLKENCLGCGLCVRACLKKGLALSRRESRVIVPLNSLHRIVVSALERGCLQNLIFDKQALWNHRLMAGILGVILKLPPVKKLMATEQVKSRYLERLCSRN